MELAAGDGAYHPHVFTLIIVSVEPVILESRHTYHITLDTHSLTSLYHLNIHQSISPSAPPLRTPKTCIYMSPPRRNQLATYVEKHPDRRIHLSICAI